MEDVILQKLDRLYTDSRYPSDLGITPYGKPSTEDARDFLKFAEYVYECVKKIVGSDVTA